MSKEEKITEIDAILRKNVKSKSLTDEAYGYMAQLITEDCPKNAKELRGLIGDFLTDGMAYTNETSLKLCQILHKMM